jgi:hypothetical protein
MGEAKEKQKNFEKYVQDLKKNYQYIFNTDEGKAVMSDLEKRTDNTGNCACRKDTTIYRNS